jgi:hypothetical protein
MEIKKKIFLISRYDITRWINIINTIDKLKWEVTDSPDTAEYVISFDAIINDSRFEKTKNVLLREEPSIVLPSNYKPQNLNQFQLIIDIGKLQTENNITLRHLQNLSVKKIDSSSRSNRLVVINSNLLSLRKGELYSLRRRAIHNLEMIDVFGYGWEKSFSNKIKTVLIEFRNILRTPSKFHIIGQLDFLKKTPRYKGSTPDKFKTLSNYKFALVIENSYEFFSEKFFDAILGGCIPIYVGLDLNQFKIPDNLYLKAEANLHSIAKAYETAKSMDYKLWENQAADWLNNKDTYKLWSEEAFFINLDKVISEFYQ